MTYLFVFKVIVFDDSRLAENEARPLNLLLQRKYWIEYEYNPQKSINDMDLIYILLIYAWNIKYLFLMNKNC